MLTKAQTANVEMETTLLRNQTRAMQPAGAPPNPVPVYTAEHNMDSRYLDSPSGSFTDIEGRQQNYATPNQALPTGAQEISDYLGEIPSEFQGMALYLMNQVGWSWTKTKSWIQKNMGSTQQTGTRYKRR